MITVVLKELSRLFINACCMLWPQPKDGDAIAAFVATSTRKPRHNEHFLMITVVLKEVSRLFIKACCMLRPQPKH